MMSASDTGSGVDSSPAQNVMASFTKLQRQYQQILDRWTPHMLYRWLGTGGVFLVFVLRIVLAQGVCVQLTTFVRRAEALCVVVYRFVIIALMGLRTLLIFASLLICEQYAVSLLSTRECSHVLIGHRRARYLPAEPAACFPTTKIRSFAAGGYYSR